MSNVAVMGTGSWGTTFAKVMADAGCTVQMWGRRPDVCAEINREHRNSAYLGDIRLPEGVTATTDAVAAITGARVVVLAVPAQTLRANLLAWAEAIGPDQILVSLIKGLELGTMARMSQVIAEVTGAGPERIVVVSGPNLAREIANEQPTATVIACTDLAVATEVAGMCDTPYMRPYMNTDVVGVELGGVLKNVTALAVGVAEGMGFGDNTKATIITRGLAETTRLAMAAGGLQVTMAGLAGIGDLVATCASPLSRNRTFGVALGKGLSVQEATAATKYTAEGVKSAGPVLKLAAGLGVEMPITEQIVALISGETTMAEVARSLVSRPIKSEVH